MLVKGLVFAAVLASTPFAVVSLQDPPPAAPRTPASSAADERLGRELEAAQQQAARDAAALARARAELDAARAELAGVRQQLDDALDALGATFAAQRDRSCAPSRSRALMSHYQWLRGHGHDERARTALAEVVDRIGDDVRRLNGAAWSLMTDKETAGHYDEVALAIAERIEAGGHELSANVLDTVALARFLNGQVDRAVALQRRAIERGGRGDDFRRRLRTYEAAQQALARAAAPLPAAQPTTLIARSDDE